MSPLAILGILLAYFGILILMSWIISSKSDATSFYTGNRQSPWYLVAFGMIGASLSGVTFLSVPGWVASTQFGYMQTVMGYMLGYLVIALVLIPLYYRLKLTSIYTYLEQRFGEVSYKTGAGYFLLSRVIGASFRLYLVAEVLHMAVFEPLGLLYWQTVAITILLIFTYTFKSGIKTVVYTDVLQTFFLITAVVLTIFFIFQSFDWSFMEGVNYLMNDPNTQIFHWGFKGDNVFWKQFVGGAFIALVMTGLDQDMMQKNLSIANVGSAQKNIYIQMVLFLTVNIVFLSLGALLFHYVDVNQVEGITKTDQMFQVVAMQYGTPVISFFFILGLIAAAYSSADSALTALTTSFCVDFLGYERKKRTHLATRRIVHVSFAFILFLCILLFNYISNDAVINQLFKAAGFTYGPLLGMFAFGILSKRKVWDRWVLLITLVSIGVTYTYYVEMPHLIEGYKPGFELIVINGAFTYLALYFNSLTRRQKK